MFLVQQHTTIPVPKVHAVYSHLMPDRYNWDEGETKTYSEYGYLFMDIVPGATIEDSWDTWTEDTRLNVQNELQDYVRQLRQIPGGDYIGTLNRGPVTDGILRFQSDNLGTVTLYTYVVFSLISY